MVATLNEALYDGFTAHRNEVLDIVINLVTVVRISNALQTWCRNAERMRTERRSALQAGLLSFQMNLVRHERHRNLELSTLLANSKLLVAEQAFDGLRQARDARLVA